MRCLIEELKAIPDHAKARGKRHPLWGFVGPAVADSDGDDGGVSLLSAPPSLRP